MYTSGRDVLVKSSLVASWGEPSATFPFKIDRLLVLDAMLPRIANSSVAICCMELSTDARGALRVVRAWDTCVSSLIKPCRADL